MGRPVSLLGIMQFLVRYSPYFELAISLQVPPYPPNPRPWGALLARDTHPFREEPWVLEAPF
jgi:hypothetical protein